MPGVVTNLNDTVTGTATTQFPIHGGRNNEGRMTIDGLNIGNPVGGNQPPRYIADIGNAQEVTFTTSGGLGESETAGLVMNVVPKTGGNTISGVGLLQRHRREAAVRQLHAGAARMPASRRRRRYTKVYDLNGAFGGPIKKDRVWYFVNARTQGSTRTIANIYYNQNAGDPTKWTYDAGPEPAGVLGPDLGERERARHLAGHAAQQDRRLLGRAADLPEVRAG